MALAVVTDDPFVLIYRDGIYVRRVRLDQFDGTGIAEAEIAWLSLKDDDSDALGTAGRRFGFVPERRPGTLGTGRPEAVECHRSMIFHIEIISMAPTDGVQLRSASIYVGSNYVVSVAPADEACWDAAARIIEASPALLRTGVGYLFYALVDLALAGHVPEALRLEERSVALESIAITGRLTSAELSEVFIFQRDLATYRQSVRRNSVAVEAFLRKGAIFVHATTRPYLNDLLKRLGRAEALTRPSGRIVSTLGDLGLLPAAETDRVVRSLTAWAVILATFTAFTAMWSMYFGDIPGLELAWGYPTFLVLVGGLCLTLYLRIHRRRWL